MAGRGGERGDGEGGVAVSGKGALGWVAGAFVQVAILVCRFNLDRIVAWCSAPIEKTGKASKNRQKGQTLEKDSMEISIRENSLHQ